MIKKKSKDTGAPLTFNPPSDLVEGTSISTVPLTLDQCTDTVLLRAAVLQLKQVLEDLKTTDTLANSDDNWYRRKATTIIASRGDKLVTVLDGTVVLANGC